jgi:hypothetical protein
MPVESPPGLPAAERAVWQVLAPHARAAKMLTPATAGDFAVLCALEVELASVLAERRAEGWSPRGLALAKEYRGLVARVEGKRRAYRLASLGREFGGTEAPVDEWAEFDRPKLVTGT